MRLTGSKKAALESHDPIINTAQNEAGVYIVLL